MNLIIGATLAFSLLLPVGAHAGVGIYDTKINVLCELEYAGEKKIHLGIDQFLFPQNLRIQQKFKNSCSTLASKVESMYFNQKTCDGMKDSVVKMAPEMLKLQWDPRRCFMKSVVQNYTSGMAGFLSGSASNRNADGHKFNRKEMEALILPFEKGCVGHPTFSEKLACIKLEIEDKVKHFENLKNKAASLKGQWKTANLCEIFKDTAAPDVAFVSQLILGQKRTAADAGFPAWQECGDFNLSGTLKACGAASEGKLSDRHKLCVQQALRYLGSDSANYERYGQESVGYFYLLKQINKLEEVAIDLDLGIYLCRNRFDFVALKTGPRFVGRTDQDEERCGTDEMRKLLEMKSFFDLLSPDYSLNKKEKDWQAEVEKNCDLYGSKGLIPEDGLPQEFMDMGMKITSKLYVEEKAPSKSWTKEETKELLEDSLKNVSKEQDESWKGKSVEKKLADRNYLTVTAEHFQKILDKNQSSPEAAKALVDRLISFNHY